MSAPRVDGAAPPRRERPARAPRRWVRRSVVGVLLVVVLGGAFAALQLARAASSLREASSGLRRARVVVLGGDVQSARVQIREAGDRFAMARKDLDGPLIGLAARLPAIGGNVELARSLSRSGTTLAADGDRLLAAADPERLAPRQGRFPLDRLRGLAANMVAVRADVRRASGEAGSVRGWLVGPVGSARRRFTTEADGLARDLANASDALVVATRMLGETRAQRLFLAVQNPAERRGTGGIIGNWGIITADRGKVELTKFGRDTELNRMSARLPPTPPPPGTNLDLGPRYDGSRVWQNVNLDVDFADVSSYILASYRSASGQQLDGVVGVDPLGLAALLALSGPVRVQGLDRPVNAANVVEVTLLSAYSKPKPERVELLGRVAKEVWANLTNPKARLTPKVIRGLARATSAGHLRVWSANPADAPVLDRLGVSGHLAKPAGDGLLVVSSNGAANKVDLFVRRSIRYEVELRPSADGRRAAVRGSITIGFRNDAPATGLPSYVLGPAPSDPGLFPGMSRALVQVLTPLGVRTMQVGGTARTFESSGVPGWLAAGTSIDVPPKRSLDLRLTVEGTVPLDRGAYRLELPVQPGVNPDQIEVRIRVVGGRLEPPGPLGPGEQAASAGDRTWSWRATLDRPRRIAVALRPER
ncbi:MAG: DUF4012 domain-containing protein [Actinobacteria bacterium]|nr:DUF4012 domain-containing protein [Actinomycetota bacterium]